MNSKFKTKFWLAWHNYNTINFVNIESDVAACINTTIIDSMITSSVLLELRSTLLSCHDCSFKIFDFLKIENQCSHNTISRSIYCCNNIMILVELKCSFNILYLHKPEPLGTVYSPNSKASRGSPFWRYPMKENLVINRWT